MRKALAFAFASLLIGVGIQQAAAADKLRVGKTTPQGFAFIPADIGQQHGIFAKYGIEIEIVNFTGGARLHQGMVAGAADIALGSGPDFAFLVKGAPEIGVADFADPPLDMALTVPYDSPVKTIDDLKGKKIGVTSQGSTTYWLVYQLNRAKGWTGDDAAKPIVIGGSPTAGFAGLKTGDIDADVGGTSTGYQLEEHGDGRLLIDCSEYVPPIALYMIFASTSLAKQNPEAVRGFLKGWYDSIAFMKSHKAESVPIAAKVMGYTPRVAERMYDTLMMKFSTDGKFNPQAFDTLRESFVDMKTLDPASVDMSKFYTTEFLPQT